MTDAVAMALVAGVFGVITTTVTTVGTIISSKTQKAAKAAEAEAKAAVAKVTEVHGQALENFGISQANHETLAKVVQNTDGNVRKLQEAWAAEARRREKAAWDAGHRAGRSAEINKTRRATDPPADLPPPVNDDEPKE